MGTIIVEGIGPIEIAGDEPTPEEATAIAAGVQEEDPLATPEADPAGEGRTGLIPEEFRAGVREKVEDMPGLLQFLTEMTPATGGAIGGAALGAPLGPVGVIGGGILGGLLGEFIGQETGVTPESDVALGLAAAGPVIGKGLGAAVKLGRKAVGKAVGKLPPAKAALSAATQKAAVPEFESIGGKILASQKGLLTRPSSELYDAAKKVGAHIAPQEFRKTFQAFAELATELRVFGAFPEGQQALALVNQALQTLTASGQVERITGVSFKNLIAARQMVGIAVDKATVAGGIRLGSSKQLFKELADVINRVSIGKTAARRGAKIAKAAAARAKLEFSVRDFEAAVASFTKIKPGEDIVSINIADLQNWLLNITNPKAGRKIFDKNFTDALKDHLPDIKKRLLELNKIAGTGSAAGPGSIVVRGIGARTGRSLAGAIIGAGAVINPLAAAGALLGASMPEMLTGLLSSKAGFALLKKTIGLGNKPISAKAWIAFGELLTRGPQVKVSKGKPSKEKPFARKGENIGLPVESELN